MRRMYDDKFSSAITRILEKTNLVCRSGAKWCSGKKYKNPSSGVRNRCQKQKSVVGTSTPPCTFRQEEAKNEEEEENEESKEESEEEPEKQKGNQGIIEIQNTNLVKPKNVKARDVDMDQTTELSRREREAIEKQKVHERYMRLREQGKTKQAKTILEVASAIAPEVTFLGRVLPLDDDKQRQRILSPFI